MIVLEDDPSIQMAGRVLAPLVTVLRLITLLFDPVPMRAPYPDGFDRKLSVTEFDDDWVI